MDEKQNGPDNEEGMEIAGENTGIGNNDSDNKKRTGNPVIAELLDWIKIIAIAVAAAMIINHLLIANANIPSGSMENTIMTGDRLIGLRTSYWFSSPKRGDIAIFRYPDDETKIYIKRVIGLPGETVEIKDGLVYIDGSKEPLKEDYIKGKPEGDFGPYEVPEDSYFMLGDNRTNSKDSRFWLNPYVNENKILAKAMFQYLKQDQITEKYSLSFKWLGDRPEYGEQREN